jgi:2-polyprenyl-6-methoxyphenol hydroxylase-like FAD-dependent oxidoreductase
VNATVYRERPSLTCGYYSYWSGLDSAGLNVHILPRPALALAFPTNDALTCVAVQWPVAEFHAVRANVEKAFFAVLDLIPSLAERVRAGRREERFRGTADLQNFIHQAVGPGWALAGDAGAHKDPLLASGISDAFSDAATLAEALDSGLSGRKSLDASLAAWGRQRDATILSSYESSSLAATFPPPSPELLRLRAAIRGDQAAVDAFLGLGRGTITDQEFARLVA